MKEGKNVMICVTQQKTCARLIKAGTEIQKKLKGEIFVVHVAPIGWNILGNSKQGEALDYLFDISKTVGAHMTVLRSSDVVKSIIDFCEKHTINTILLGESGEKFTDGNIIAKLKKQVGKNVVVSVISTD